MESGSAHERPVQDQPLAFSPEGVTPATMQSLRPPQESVAPSRHASLLRREIVIHKNSSPRSRWPAEIRREVVLRGSTIRARAEAEPRWGAGKPIIFDGGALGPC